MSANVALGAVHWRNVDRLLEMCGRQIALKAINTIGTILEELIVAALSLKV